MNKALVTGAAGFLGGHLCRFLKERDYWVRAVDYARPRYGKVACDEQNWRVDLRNDSRIVAKVFDGIDEVYAMAADMGGMGYISHGHFTILQNNLRINLVTSRAAKKAMVKRLLFTSSACVYPERLQMGNDVVFTDLVEGDAWDGKPDTAYGVEKLVSEDIYEHLGRETDTQIRIARFHNIFGPKGSWKDGREKAPAALCRKVAVAKLTGDRNVEIWGDGEQTRSFCYVDDCMEMLHRLALSDYREPLNIGADRMVTINELVDIIADVAGIEVIKQHDTSKPQGVRQRNADLTEMREQLQYESKFSLEDGLRETYKWIEEQVKQHGI